MVVTLEPIEAIRVLANYGNPDVKVLTNMRPIYPAGVIAGESTYPEIKEIETMLKKLSARAWFIDATDEAVKLGNAILGNIIMIGALSAVGDLPVGRDDFEAALSRTLPAEKMADNLTAFDLGVELMKQ
jgi:indolepyruvate ferredoxin oxidoreductase beta subunit